MAAEKAVASGANTGDGARKRAVGQAQNGSDAQPAQPEDDKKLAKKVNKASSCTNCSAAAAG